MLLLSDLLPRGKVNLCGTVFQVCVGNWRQEAQVWLLPLSALPKPCSGTNDVPVHFVAHAGFRRSPSSGMALQWEKISMLRCVNVKEIVCFKVDVCIHVIVTMNNI